MTVFLTPDREPFFGGTYFPARRPLRPARLPDAARAHRRPLGARRAGLARPGLGGRRSSCARARASAPRPLRGRGRDRRKAAAAARARLRRALGRLRRRPQVPALRGAVAAAARPPPLGDTDALRMATRTLDDDGAGRHATTRSAAASTATRVDERWLVPHFEKMLYDNAQLARVYLEAYQATGEPLYRRVARGHLDYVLREMTSPEGGFYSAHRRRQRGRGGQVLRLDAGRGARGARRRRRRRGSSARTTTSPEAGNFEGHSILNVPRPLDEVAAELGLTRPELDASLAARARRLYAARRPRAAGPRRQGPDRLERADDRRLGRGLPRDRRAELPGAGRARGRLPARAPRARGRAAAAHLRGGQGAPRRATSRTMPTSPPGCWTSTRRAATSSHLREAERLAGQIRADFSAEDGGFYSTARGHERLIVRHREGHDGATPAANAVAAHVLARLSYHLDREDLRERALEAHPRPGARPSRGSRGAFTTSLAVVDLLLEGPSSWRSSVRTAIRARSAARGARPPLPAEPHRRAARSRAARADLPLLAGKDGSWTAAPRSTSAATSPVSVR